MSNRPTGVDRVVRRLTHRPAAADGQRSLVVLSEDAERDCVGQLVHSVLTVCSHAGGRVKRDDLFRAVLPEGCRRNEVRRIWEKVRNALRNVHGCQLVEDEKYARTFYAVSRLPELSVVGLTAGEKFSVFLAYAALAVIFMSNPAELKLPRADVWRFIDRLRLYPDGESPVVVNGVGVKDLLEKEFVRQGWLRRTVESDVVEYSWGSRAKAVINKEQLLEFVAAVQAGDGGVADWPEHARLAKG